MIWSLAPSHCMGRMSCRRDPDLRTIWSLSSDPNNTFADPSSAVGTKSVTSKCFWVTLLKESSPCVEGGWGGSRWGSGEDRDWEANCCMIVGSSEGIGAPGAGGSNSWRQVVSRPSSTLRWPRGCMSMLVRSSGHIDATARLFSEKPRGILGRHYTPGDLNTTSSCDHRIWGKPRLFLRLDVSRWQYFVIRLHGFPEITMSPYCS